MMKTFNNIMAIALVAAATVTLPACKDDYKVDDLAPWLQVSNSAGTSFPSIIETDFGGGEFSFTVYTNDEWNITTTADWLEADPSERLGCVTGTFRVLRSEVEEVREGDFILTPVNGKLRTYKIHVVQGAAPENITTYHILPEQKGDGSGRSWDDAMGPESFASLFSDAVDLTAKEVVLGEGEFLMPNNIFVSKKIKCVRGMGIDKTHIKPAAPASNHTYLFNLRNCDVTFEGIDFNGGLNVLAQDYQKCFYMESMATLRLNNCRIGNFNSAKGEPWDGVGCAVRFNYDSNLRLYCANVLFEENRVTSRGVIQNGSAAGSFAMFENCKWVDNCTNDNWGICYHGSTESTAMMHNCSFINNYSLGNWRPIMLNTDGDLAVTGCTFYADKTIKGNLESMIRYNEQRTRSILGNLFYAESGNVNSIFNEDGAPAYESGGGNVFQIMYNCQAGNSDNVIGNTTKLGTRLNGNVVEWEPTAEVIYYLSSTTQAKTLKEFVSSNCPGIGSDFYNWVGQSSFLLDCRGESRNSDKMQPGAYDKGL